MLGKLAELILFGVAPMMLGALFMPGAVAAEEIALTGEVAYRERIALPPNAVLTVRLTDVSLADAPGAVIAEQKIEQAGQVPIKFDLRYDPAVVQPKMNYALQARITVDDKLWFTTDQRYSVDPLKPEQAKLLLVRQQ
jgi:putative lipoprotein